MFKNNFIKLCNERGESPSFVCRKVNISPATFSGWTDESVPRQATLLRIADYFGVTVDDLLAEPDAEVGDVSPELLRKRKALIDIINTEDNMDILDILDQHIELLKKSEKKGGE